MTAVGLFPVEGAGPAKELLLVGSGPFMQVYRAGEGNSSPLCSYQVFEADRIHGFRLIYIDSRAHVFVFGTFCSAIVALQFNEADGSPIECCRALELFAVPADMILDGISGDSWLMIGHGQNFLSVYDLSSGRCTGHVRSAMVCVLFSLCFGRRRSDGTVPVASGTAMGDIYLWDVDPSTNGAGAAPIPPRVALTGHEGVVCKMCWNKDCSKLASVSDDRTVRLWDAVTGSILFTGWGHACRVWDVTFHGDNENELITCGEDLTIKLWDVVDQICLSTMEGHVGRNVWCIVYSSALDCIFSGGNDSSVKMWALDVHRVLSPESGANVSGTLTAEKELLSSDTSPSSAVDMSPMLRGEVASVVKLSEDAKDVYVVTQSGRIIIVNLEHKTRTTRGYQFSGIRDSVEVNIPCVSPVHTADLRTPTSAQSFAYLFSGHVDGTATISIFQRGVLLAAQAWKAHKVRTIGIWIVELTDTCVRGVTASVGGELKVWEIEYSSSAEVVISGVTCASELSAGRKQIASCATLLSSCSSSHFSGSILVGGCKGAVSLFQADKCKKTSTTAQETPFQPSFCIPHVHGHEKVGSILEISNGFLSCGSNGTICVHKFSDAGFSAVANLDNGLVTCCEMVSVPDQFRVDNPAMFCLDPTFVCGFQGNMYRIWDIRGKYELLKVEAGGWRRLHDCVLALNSGGNCSHPQGISFVSLDCSGKLPVLHVHSVISANTASDKRSTNAPLYFGQSSNGRVMYCGEYIGANADLFAAAGEEGVVKLFDLPNMRIVQEVRLPQDCPIRTMNTCLFADMSGNGILVAAGGRLSFAVWMINARIGGSDTTYPSLAPVLQFASAGHSPKNATQEHRILSSASWYATPHGVPGCYIVLCDSRGCVRLFFFTIESRSLQLVWETIVSEYPILACSLLNFGDTGTDDQTFCCFGDTSGFVYVYALAVNSEA